MTDTMTANNKKTLQFLKTEIPRFILLLNREPREYVELPPFHFTMDSDPVLIIPIIQNQQRHMEKYKGRILDMTVQETEDGKFQFTLAISVLSK